MSTLSRQIRANMTDLWQEGNTGCSRFKFPADFIGFKGHFPKKAVLPGVCKIQAVLATFEAFTGRKGTIRQIKLAKFFSPVSAGQEIILRCTMQPGEEDTVDIKAAITSGETKVAQVQLKVLVGHAA